MNEPLKYLVYVGERPVACLAWSSAPWHIGPRDRFIGWVPAVRRKNLHLLAYNTRFLVLPWVQVRHNRITINELKKLIFGAKTEKTQKVLKSATQDKPKEKNDAPKKMRKGHGRNGVDAYTGAERVCLKCAEVRPGDRCPECGKGKLYPCKPSEIVCIRGQAPIQAAVYEQERLRCNLCGAQFKAAAPKQWLPWNYRNALPRCASP